MQIQHKLSCISTCVAFSVFGSGSWATHRCVHFNDTLSLCSPETLTLKGLSWCVSVSDESGSDPLEQWVTTLPNVHKHTHRELDVSGSATQSRLRGNSVLVWGFFSTISSTSKYCIYDSPFYLVMYATAKGQFQVFISKINALFFLNFSVLFVTQHSCAKVSVRFLFAHRKDFFAVIWTKWVQK